MGTGRAGERSEETAAGERKNKKSDRLTLPLPPQQHFEGFQGVQTHDWHLGNWAPVSFLYERELKLSGHNLPPTEPGVGGEGEETVNSEQILREEKLGIKICSKQKSVCSLSPRACVSRV